MIKYQVELGSRSYPIFIGEDALAPFAETLTQLNPTKIIFVTNETVAPLYLEKIEKCLGEYMPQVPKGTCVLADGEKYKDWETIEVILKALQEIRADRATVVVALGGGVIGDMAGFAAGIWMRGIRFVQVPTTLLAQVDSSVGGKTGVNLPYGKNLIGVFHQPKAVLIDPRVLKTLPDREITAGLGEIIKYGILGDAAFFARLEKDISKLRAQDATVLEEVIAHCCEMKAKIVREDEKEAGVRALLNLGHTFGHAIEKVAGYGVWLHGEAVGAGLVMAAALSRDLGMLKEKEVERIRALVSAAGLPVTVKGISSEAALSAMHGDKKARANALRFVLIDGIGKSVTETVSEEKVLRVMREFGW